MVPDRVVCYRAPVRLTQVYAIALATACASAPPHPAPVIASAPAPVAKPPAPAPADVDAADAAVARGCEANEAWEFETAARELESAVAAYDRAFPHGDPKIEPVLMALARAYRGAGKWDLAEKAARRAGRLAAGANDAAEVLLAQNELGLIYEESGRSDEAIGIYKAALDGAKDREGDDVDDARVSLEHNLGLAYSNRDDFAPAEEMLERVLEHDRKQDPRSVSTANTMHNLALAYRDDHKLGKAKVLFEEALAILTEHLGPKHARLGPTLNGLAGTLKLQNDLVPAEAMYRRSIAIAEANGTFDYIAAADLADVETDLGHAKEALVLIDKSLAAQKARSEYPRDEIVRTLVKRMRAHLKLHEYAAAEVDTEAAISTSRQANANRPSQVQATINWIADEWKDAGKTKRAAAIRAMQP